MVFEPCKTGDLSLLRSILASSIAPAAQLERRDSSGKTPLMRAIKYGHVDIVAFLLQQGADVQAVCTKQQRTCMHLAAAGGHLLVAKLLLQHGAAVQLQQPDHKGRIPFQVISARNRTDLEQLFTVAAEQHTAAHHTKDNAVQGTFNMWSQQALGLDPIREERTSSEASSGRRSLQTINFAQPSGGLDAADLFWFASDRRRSTSFEPMYFDPSTADCGIDDAAAPLHRRRSFDARLAQKPQRRASFDADRMQHKHQERTGDPVALAAAAAVSHAVQARASFESARASFDLQGGQGGQRRRTSMDATAYTGRRSCSHEVRQEPYVRRDWCIE